MRPLRIPALSASFLLFAAACGPAPGTLNASKARSVAVAPAHGAPIYCAGGAPVPLVARVRLDDGTELRTAGPGEPADDRLAVDAFVWSASTGNVDGQGALMTPADPVAAMSRPITVWARLASRPAVSGSVELQPSFGCGGVFAFDGEAGAAGMGGEPGTAGVDGDDRNAHHGADSGRNGGEGSPGRAGADGGPGPSIDVYVTYVETPVYGRLVALRVQPLSGPAVTHLWDPAGKRLVVSARGGRGGDGGSGGNGGRGGAGGSSGGARGGTGAGGGTGGNGGNGGRGGAGGPGGAILLHYDLHFPELARLVAVDNHGGVAGRAGAAGLGGNGGQDAPSPDRIDGTSGAGAGGTAGREGQVGGVGADGAPPEARPEDVSSMFADLAARGLHLAAPAPAGAPNLPVSQ